MRAIDVCAGAGGLSLGLGAAGWEVLGVDSYRPAVIVNREHVGPCALADVCSWSPTVADGHETATLVAGGVPCQTFSPQGKRAGFGERIGALFPETPEPRALLYLQLVRIAVEARARAVLLENVPGLLDDPEHFHAIRVAMAGAGFSYVLHEILDAADYGTPQHRRRLFVVAFRDALDAEVFTWPEKTHGPGRELPWVTVRQALALGDEPFAKGERNAKGWQGHRAIDVDAPSYTIGTKRNPDWLVPAGPGGGAQWDHARRLNVAQCSALQGFPSDWRWPPRATVAHRLIGNAVPPQLAEALGWALSTTLER